MVHRVLCIHGTFAADPTRRDHGPAWWQLQSATCGDLTGRLGAEYEIVSPFHWTGHNDEGARRRAGRQLANRLAALDTGPFHVIAHSHGGNVLWDAFITADLRGHPLRNLKSWTTVGTPFLHFRPVLHVSRVLSGALALLLVPALLRMSASVVSLRDVLVDQGPYVAVAAFWFATGLGLVGSAYLAASAALHVVAFLLAHRRHRASLRCVTRYGDRHVSLWSESDEAIAGLRGVHVVNDQMISGYPEWVTSLGTLKWPIVVLIWPYIVGRMAANAFLTHRLRRYAFGHFGGAEVLVDVTTRPNPSEPSTPLASDMHDELVAAADQASAVAIGSARQALGLLAIGAGFGRFVQAAVSREAFSALVHTSYFAFPRIRAAIAAAVRGAATTAGHPTARFDTHVDLRLRERLIAIAPSVAGASVVAVIALMATILYGGYIEGHTLRSRIAAMNTNALDLHPSASPRLVRAWVDAACDGKLEFQLDRAGGDRNFLPARLGWVACAKARGRGAVAEQAETDVFARLRTDQSQDRLENEEQHAEPVPAHQIELLRLLAEEYDAKGRAVPAEVVGVVKAAEAAAHGLFQARSRYVLVALGLPVPADFDTRLDVRERIAQWTWCAERLAARQPDAHVTRQAIEALEQLVVAETPPRGEDLAAVARLWKTVGQMDRATTLLAKRNVNDTAVLPLVAIARELPRGSDDQGDTLFRIAVAVRRYGAADAQEGLGWATAVGLSPGVDQADWERSDLNGICTRRTRAYGNPPYDACDAFGRLGYLRTCVEDIQSGRKSRDDVFVRSALMFVARARLVSEESVRSRLLREGALVFARVGYLRAAIELADGATYSDDRLAAYTEILRRWSTLPVAALADSSQPSLARLQSRLD
jgi:hypothetical protein